jgi:hypothetical protein
MLFDRVPFIDTLDMPNITVNRLSRTLETRIKTPTIVKRRLLGIYSLLLHKKGIKFVTHFKI